MKSIAECLKYNEEEWLALPKEIPLAEEIIRNLIRQMRRKIEDLEKEVSIDNKEDREITPAGRRLGELIAYQDIERFLSDATRGNNG